MVQFTHTHLYCSILHGYRFLQYEPHKYYGKITPLYSESDIPDYKIGYSYILPIDAEECLQMASGAVDLLDNFGFYIIQEDHVL